MSVQTQIDRISGERDNQAELIRQIQEALVGKASSGETTDILLQSKIVTPSTEAQTVVADNGYDGLSQVVVNAIPDEYLPSESAQKYLIKDGVKQVAFTAENITESSSNGSIFCNVTGGISGYYYTTEPILMTDYSTMYVVASNTQTDRDANFNIMNSAKESQVVKTLPTLKDTIKIDISWLNGYYYPRFYGARSSDGSSYYGAKIYIYDIWLE